MARIGVADLQRHKAAVERAGEVRAAAIRALSDSAGRALLPDGAAAAAREAAEAAYRETLGAAMRTADLAMAQVTAGREALDAATAPSVAEFAGVGGELAGLLELARVDVEETPLRRAAATLTRIAESDDRTLQLVALRAAGRRWESLPSAAQLAPDALSFDRAATSIAEKLWPTYGREMAALDAVEEAAGAIALTVARIGVMGGGPVGAVEPVLAVGNERG